MGVQRRDRLGGPDGWVGVARMQTNDSGSARQRVLVVDDHADTVDMLRTMFELLGHETRVAFTGCTAVAIARSFEPHLVVLDLGLPDISGFEVAELLRADERTARGYVVALSGHAREEHVQRARQAGCDTHLAKPMALASIHRMLRDSADCMNERAERYSSVG